MLKISVSPGLIFPILRYLIDIVFYDFQDLWDWRQALDNPYELSPNRSSNPTEVVSLFVRRAARNLVDPVCGPTVCGVIGVRIARPTNQWSNSLNQNRTLSSTTWSCMGCPISSLHLKVDMFTRLFVIIGIYRTRKYF